MGGFDAKATLLLVNPPVTASPFSVGAQLSWYAPVVHVKKVDSVGETDANFVVTFVDSASADRALSANISTWSSEEGSPARPIRMKRLAAPEGDQSWWSFW